MLLATMNGELLVDVIVTFNVYSFELVPVNG